jgi:hypothetical protein
MTSQEMKDHVEKLSEGLYIKESSERVDTGTREMLMGG